MPALFASVARATEAFNIVTGIPGPVDLGTTKAGIAAFVQNGYFLALGVAGILAVASIVYGAVQYSASRGNPSKLADSWDRIVQALIGILLLVGAGAILTLINPGLLRLELPGLTKLEGGFEGEVLTVTLEFEEDNQQQPTLPSTVSCKTDASKCASLKAAGFTCAAKKSPGCDAQENFVRTLNCAIQKLGINASDVRVTEAYPPDITHIDPRHNNGCSIDTTLSRSAQAGGCDRIKAYVTALKECGATALNEYADKDSFSGIDYRGCGVKPKDKNGNLSWGGNNVHVNICPRGTP